MTRRYGLGAKHLAGVLACATALAIAPAAHAQAKPKKADAAATKGAAKKDDAGAVDPKKKYGDGVKAYKLGAYAEALADFQAADAVKQTPQAARYIGLCQDALKQYPDAVAAYERFLANVPAKMKEEGEDTKVQARLAEIKKMPGRVHVDSDPKGAVIALDGAAQPGITPTDIDVPPGHHTLRVSTPDRDPVDRPIDVTFASKQDVMVSLPASAPVMPPPVAVVPPPPPVQPSPMPAEPPPPAAEPVHHSLVPAYVTGGLAIAAAGVGTVFGVMALSDKSDFDAHPSNDKADDGENHALIADMAFGVAVTLGVTSLVLFLSHDDTPTAPHPAPTADAEPRPKAAAFEITYAPIVTQHGGGAGALVRF